MAHHLQFLSKHFRIGLVESVELGVGREGEVVVEHTIEAVDGVAHHLVGSLIPSLHDLVGVPTLGVVEHRGDVDVFQDVEGCRDGDVVLHAILPVFHEGGMKQFVLFGGDGIGECSRIFHADFLIPAFFTHCHLAFERIEGGE